MRYAGASQPVDKICEYPAVALFAAGRDSGGRMRTNIPRIVLLAIVAAGAFACPRLLAADTIIETYVNQREFLVTVAPADEESRNAKSAELYQALDPQREWKRLGACETVRKGGEPRFLRVVTVETDGIYYYTSRPVVGEGESVPPPAGSRPQAMVIVDTLPPVVELLEPRDGATPTAGSDVRLRWVARDENIAENPVSIAYSVDGGETWVGVADGLPSAGTSEWNIPGQLSGPLLLRVLARDRAGNVGLALRSLEITPMPPVKEKPAPEAKTPESPKQPEPVKEEPKPTKTEPECGSQKAWMYYYMAINLTRQGKPKDALQYYWKAVSLDPCLTDAWADIALLYRELGAYKTAHEALAKAQEREPDRPDFIHLEGEIYHAEGMARLQNANGPEDRREAQRLISKAVELYGRTLEIAKREWRLAEQAPTYFRLGEICYFVNLDMEGARAYWTKILELFSPTPNIDLMLWSYGPERDEARDLYRRYTHMRVSLETWQGWARGYLEQLDERQRQGIMDVSPEPSGPPLRPGVAERPFKNYPGDVKPGNAAGDALGQGSRVFPGQRAARGKAAAPAATPTPDRESERSLFSLPGQYGSPAQVPEASAEAMAQPGRQDNSIYQMPFGGSEQPARGGQRRGSLLTGAPPTPISRSDVRAADPFLYPEQAGAAPGWMGGGPYGNAPTR